MGPAGTFDSRGYAVIGFCGRREYAHRHAFLIMTGEMPRTDIDHKNLDRSDNRWSNLRMLERPSNIANSGVRSNNTSGYPGVTWNQRLGLWQARIRANGSRRYLGAYRSAQDASAAYFDSFNSIHGFRHAKDTRQY